MGSSAAKTDRGGPVPVPRGCGGVRPAPAAAPRRAGRRRAAVNEALRRRADERLRGRRAQLLVVASPASRWPASGLAFYLSLALAPGPRAPRPRRAARHARGALVAARARPRPARRPPAARACRRSRSTPTAGCASCTYVLSAAALVALLPARRAARGTLAAPPGREGRLALAGWALGTLAVAGAVFASDVRSRLPRRAAAGDPARARRPPRRRRGGARSAPAEPAPAAAAARRRRPGGPGADRRTRSTGRSGPRSSRRRSTTRSKLEAYFSEKAQREFDDGRPVSIDVGDAPARGPGDRARARWSSTPTSCARSAATSAWRSSQFVPQAGGRVVGVLQELPARQSPATRSCPQLDPPRRLQPRARRRLRPAARASSRPTTIASSRPSSSNPQPADVVRLAGEAGLNAAAIAGLPRRPEDEGRRSPPRSRRRTGSGSTARRPSTSTARSCPASTTSSPWWTRRPARRASRRCPQQ